MYTYDSQDKDSDAISVDESSVSISSNPSYDEDRGVHGRGKKIRKKRNSYQKIDDEIRVQLLKEVQQGDTLKAAAKRHGINYSTAKSILHTYRKEGRIHKKSSQGRNPPQQKSNSKGQCQLETPTIECEKKILEESISFPIVSETPKTLMQPEIMKPIAPITNNFEQVSMPSMNYYQMPMPNMQKSLFSQMEMNQVPTFNQFENQFSMMRPEKRIFECSPLNQFGMMPQVLRMRDNYYMNYSNSPLSCERIMIDGSTKSSNRFVKEYDCFGDIYDAFEKKQPTHTEDSGNVDKYLDIQQQQQQDNQDSTNTGEDSDCLVDQRFD